MHFFLSLYNVFINIHKIFKIRFVYQTSVLKYYDSPFIWYQFFKFRIYLAADILVMLFVHPFKFSNIFLFFLTFSLIFINTQIRQFVYHTIGLKCKVSTFIW